MKHKYDSKNFMDSQQLGTRDQAKLRVSPKYTEAEYIGIQYRRNSKGMPF